MIIAICKRCNAEFTVDGRKSVEPCRYCGSLVPILHGMDDSARVNAFKRAEQNRRNGDFDEAARLYRKILDQDLTDAEAYWSLLECRYGVQYVKDPGNDEIKFTVSRMRYASILEDEDYKSAMENATDEQREVYKDTAAAIAATQKEFLRIAQNEKPFDVFICYKEADADGRRTEDSVLAGKIYAELTEMGYRVFYSRETLREYPGEKFEPHIFAALYSAKLMLLVATSSEYVESTWVRNEWKRYLDQIDREGQLGQGKLLLPVLKMSPEKLPQALRQLQAIEMSRHDAMSKLMSYVRARIPKEEAEPNPERNSDSIAERLMDRAFRELRDRRWKTADQCCEGALNRDFEAARAHLGKLLVEYEARNLNELSTYTESVAENIHFKRAMQYADEPLRAKLQACEQSIQKNIQQAEMEEQRRKEEEQQRFLQEICEFMERQSIEEEKRKQAARAELEKKQAAEAEQRRIAAEAQKKREAELKKQREKAVYCAMKNGLMAAGILLFLTLAMIGIDLLSKDSVNVAGESGFWTLAMISAAAAAILALLTDLCSVRTIGIARTLVVVGRISLAIACVCALGFTFIVCDNALPEEVKGIFNPEAVQKIQLVDDKLAKFFGIETDAAPEDFSALDTRLNVGDTIAFGRYEQDNNTSNGAEPIEWLVLDRDGDRALLLSQQVLDAQPFCESSAEAEWNTSDVRAWLNDAFLNAAFSAEAQERLIEVATGDGEADCSDRVFLLSREQERQYFQTDEARKAVPTAYALKQGAPMDAENPEETGCWWWLRTTRVGSSGRRGVAVIMESGSDAMIMCWESGSPKGGVRPAIWVRLAQYQEE